MNKEKQIIEEMAKHCPFYEEGKCNLLEDEATECNFDCDMCDFATNLYNADYRKQEWISVEDRLPERSGDYLTYHEHGSCGVIYYNADIKLWNVYYSDDVRNAIRSITHWMPLPEAPKMKGGAE